MKKIILALMIVLLSLGSVVLPVKAEDTKDVPVYSIDYDSEKGLVITSEDTDWLTGIMSTNYGIKVTVGNAMKTISGPMMFQENNTLTIDESIIKSGLHLFNGTYSVVIQSEGYYWPNDTFAVDSTVPVNTSVTIENDEIVVQSEDTEYLTKLITEGQAYYSSGDNNRGFGLTLVNENDSTDDGRLSFQVSDEMNAGTYDLFIYLKGYELLFTSITIEAGAQSNIYQATVDSSGNIVLTVTDDSQFDSALKNELFTVTNRSTGRLQFIKDGITTTYSRSVMGQLAPSGMPYYRLDNENKTISIPYTKLAERGLSKGTYQVYFTTQNNVTFPLGTLTLIHEDLNLPEDLVVQYDRDEELLSINTADSNYLNNITFITLVRGNRIYVPYNKAESNEGITYDFANQRVTISREQLGNLVSKRGNGNDGDIPFYSGTYNISIDSAGYVSASSGAASTNRFVNIYPAVVKNDNPLSDDNEFDLVEGANSSSDLHNHMNSWVGSLFEVDYESGKTSSIEAEDAVKNSKVSSVVSAVIVADSTIDASDDALIEQNKDGIIAAEFDLSIYVTIDGVIVENGTLHELDKEIEYTMTIPESLPDVEEGYSREYTILRVHDGDCEEVTVAVEDNDLSFSSDLYSSYALVYKDTKDIVYVSGISLDVTQKELKVGESLSLVATVTPSDADNQTLIWSSSDISVAEVNDGTVTAKKAGAATIIATTEDGGFSAACSLTVVEPETKTVAEDLIVVPAGLSSMYETVEGLEGKLKTVLKEKSAISEENTAIYDVVLMVTFDGVNYVEADETHWPEDGKIHVVLPYPEGTDKTYEFTVAHMFTKSLFGKTAGDIEYPEVTLTEKGIEFDVTGLSPVSLGWKKEIKPTPTPETTVEPVVAPTPSVPNTSDSSNLMNWSIVAMSTLLAAIALTLMKKRQLSK
ncbi:MAG: Ig domain-containing protein [Erysipelotrichaceae bacterium]|nr:Ig domain-containing protein [Erysipelotrichaceae bacterium]